MAERWIPLFQAVKEMRTGEATLVRTINRLNPPVHIKRHRKTQMLSKDDLPRILQALENNRASGWEDHTKNDW